MPKKLRPNIQLFAEADEPGDNNQKPPTDFDEMLKTDSAFSEWLGSQTQKAAQDAEQRAKALYDTTVDEAEKLKAMSPAEQVQHYKEKLENFQKQQEKEKAASALERETAAKFEQEKIPAALLSTIDFTVATAEDVQKRIDMLNGFEFYEKGTLDAKVEGALNLKLQQNLPETHTGGASMGDVEELLAKARASGDVASICYYSRLIAQNKE